MIGKLNSLQTMGLLDGPGVRTVFFLQGCPIRCIYCHNPDTQKVGIGQDISTEEVLRIANRYKNYYGKDGGITFSGGEPLLQGKFLAETLKVLKENGFNTCIDTSAYGQRKYFREILKYTDTVLLDIKAFNRKSYQKICGANDILVKEFMNLLKKFDIMVIIRHVMIPGITDDKRSMDQLIHYIDPIIDKVDRIEILPFHQMGASKYDELGLEYQLRGHDSMDRRRARGFEFYVNTILKKRGVRSTVAKIEYTDEEKFQFTKDNALFQNLSDDEINEVKNHIDYIPMSRGELIFKSYDSSDKFYLIVKGKIKVFEYTLDGKEQILYIYGEDEFIGGHNLIKDTNYLYNGECIEPGTIGVIGREFFDEYLVNNPKVLLSLLKMSFRRIRLAEDLIQRLTAGSTDEKVASLLLQLIPSFSKMDKDNNIVLELSMTRQELASMVGVTRETLTRRLLEYENLGLIEIQGNRLIIIKDLNALRDLAQVVEDVED